MTLQSVQVSKITKRYGFHRALGGVDLQLRAGSLCALLGPNGAGKSTLLGILATLVRPTSGRISYLTASGDEPRGRQLRRQIGVLAHASFMYSGLSGLENLRFYGRLYGVSDIDARARSLLDQVGLDPKARERAAGTYSRGMVQRLALARALLHEPSILLLDEPFTGLDRTGASALATALADAKESQRIILVITHDFEPIAGLTDHIVVLRRGKVAHEDRRENAIGSPDTIGFSRQELTELYHQHSE